MTATCLKASDLTQERFLEIVACLKKPTDDALRRRIWLEAADGWCLDWWDGLESNLRWCGAGREPIQGKQGSDAYLARSKSGRLFAPDGELRWRLMLGPGKSRWRTVFLGDADWVGAGLDDYSSCLTGLLPARCHYLLWGKQTAATPGEWVDLRIPHRFRYPLAAECRNVVAIIEQWTDTSGEPHFIRLCDLQPTLERHNA